MSERTLFLAWQDPGETRRWFPVGRLDADIDAPSYRFRYIEGARRAQKEAAWPLTAEFPDIEGDYRGDDLFPTFRNRVMSPRRPDFPDYVRMLALDKSADPVELLSVSGGQRATDRYEVFPKLDKGLDSRFSCRFFVHGWRYVSEAARRRIDSLEADEELQIALELNNPVGRLAIQIQTAEYHMIGWAPRYLIRDLTAAMAESSGEYSAKIVRVNRPPDPANQRILVEMNGRWETHEPMTGGDFTPLVGD